jgi:hypothetical protein
MTRLDPSPRHAGSAGAAIPGGVTKLSVTVIRIAPAAAFEQTVRGRNLGKLPARRQMAARIHDAATKLADIQGPSTGVQAPSRTSARPDAADEGNAGAVIGFQVIDIGLEPRRVSNADTGARTGLARDDDARRVGLGVRCGLTTLVTVLHGPDDRNLVGVIARNGSVGHCAAARAIVAGWKRRLRVWRLGLWLLELAVGKRDGFHRSAAQTNVTAWGGCFVLSAEFAND